MRCWWLVAWTIACSVPGYRYTGLGDDGGGDSLPPGVAVPRLIAPMSTSTATGVKPKLQWALTPGRGTVAVDLCHDRGCADPVAVAVQIASDHQSATVGTLPPGWLYWRVRVVDGTDTITTPTWQFRVGFGSAPQDGSSGDSLDVNGDGFDDFLVGASSANTAHLYLGGSGPLAWSGATAADRIDLANPTATAGFGYAIAGVGDVNGDGFADFVVGSYNGAFVYFGSANLTPKRIDLTDGDATSSFGTSVASIGNLNHDGYGDFVIGAPQANGVDPMTGVTYVYLGSANPTTDGWNGATPSDRIALANPDTGGNFGYTVSSAGDVNGDGYGDFAIGLYGGLQKVHVYLGTATPNAAALDATRIDLNRFDTSGTGFFGSSLAKAGDINNDGYSDLLIGEFGANSYVGAIHVYFGSNAINWSAGGGRLDIAGVDGANASYGFSVAGVGDVNRDGFADFAVGATAALTGKGTGHLYLGSSSPSVPTWLSTSGHVDELGTVASGELGYASAGAGDVNNDGFADYVFGVPYASSPSITVCTGTAVGPTCSSVTGPDGTGSQFGRSLNGQN